MHEGDNSNAENSYQRSGVIGVMLDNMVQKPLELLCSKELEMFKELEYTKPRMP